ncbi:methionyl-tRNA formyltransferase [Noviherbaspirillum sp.]|uniref:methionyl-tRNA formyltransferase n=1 Tax=Noviherbaspirillum sp. TaxID=1926288 RepID=UPI002DDDB7A2|nr:formyltransferase family protein [Noviherbaspirillum sp.]
MQAQHTDANALRVCLITHGLSPIVAPLYAEPRVKLVSIVESAPRPQRSTSMPRRTAERIYRRVRFRDSLEYYAKARNLPYFSLSKENLPSLGERLKEQQCDVLVVHSMSHLLPASILEIPRFGTLNLHPSKLPAYRGPNPIFWMYYNTETSGGVTLHYLDAGEDTGDIVYQASFAINPGMSYREMHDTAIKKHGIQLVLNALQTLADGSPLPRTRQPKESPTVRARRVKSEEYRTAIDWQSWPVERVWHFLRGADSWINDVIGPPPGFAPGQDWTVLEYERKRTASRRLGAIEKDRHGHYLVCKDGVVRLETEFKTSNFLKFIYRKL